MAGSYFVYRDPRHPPDLTRVSVETARLRLRPVEPGDAPQVFRHFTPAVTRYMWPRSPQQIGESQAFIDRARAGAERGDNLVVAILRRDGGEFLGCCGVHGGDNGRTPELGIWIKEAAHGHGYGKEAVLAMKQWADEHLLYDYLIYPVDRRNRPSRRIPEAMGGEVFETKLATAQDGRTLDEVVYRIWPPAGD